MNGIVEMQPKGPSSVVVAVPVCRPARPARAHPSLAVSFTDGNMAFAHGSASFAGGNATFADVSTSFSDGNAATRTFGRAHRHRPYHSKHVLPFRKGENKSFNACGASANGKTKNLALAELPQIAKQKIWRLRSFRKWQNKKFDACGASANGKTKNLVLAELPQMTKQKFWRLQSFRKRSETKNETKMELHARF